VDRISNCGPTGTWGTRYLETRASLRRRRQRTGTGSPTRSATAVRARVIVGQPNILAYAQSHYRHGESFEPTTDRRHRPAYKAGRWWTGDENHELGGEFNDVGADGVPNARTRARGRDADRGEPNFDRTGQGRSDQIGLTGSR